MTATRSNNQAASADRPHTGFLLILRVLTLLIVAAVSLVPVLRADASGSSDDVLVRNWILPSLVGLGLYAAALAVDLLTPNKKIATVGGVFFGVIAGLVATLALSFIIDLVGETYAQAVQPGLLRTLKVLVGVACCYLAVSVVLQTQNDFRLLVPYVEFSKELRGPRPMVLDTSALVDGRALGLARSGFLQAPLLLPRFVVEELQRLADAPDKHKRQRGRRGLDTATKLRNLPGLDIRAEDEDHSSTASDVDAKLIELTNRRNGTLLTTDDALARTAKVRGTAVLTLNALAEALRPSVTIGDEFRIEIQRIGEQQSQGIGYLPDGSMVVVAGAGTSVSEHVGAVITRSVQTSGGRLYFAKRSDDDTPETDDDSRPTP